MSKISHAAVQASDHPTPAQLKELFNQIQHGVVTKESLQAFLRGRQSKPKQNRHLVIPGVPAHEVSSLLTYWEKWFPEKGNAIVSLLGPFLSRSFDFEVHELWADEGFCKDAIFWREVSGFIPVPSKSFYLGLETWHKLPNSDFSAELTDFLREKSEQDTWELIVQAVEYTDSGNAIHYLNDIGDESLWSWGIRDSLGVDPSGWQADCSDNWLACCYAAIACQYFDEEFHRRVQSLMSLWRFGNIPLGFEGNKLVLLCKP